jgi:outer membrane protein assembly factor BamB
MSLISPRLLATCGVLGLTGGLIGLAAAADYTQRQAAPAGWLGFGHDAAHTGTALARGPQTGTLRWTRKLDGPIAPGAAVADGVVYAASNGGVLHAMDLATGKDRWTFDGHGHYGSDLSTVPAVLQDGTILWPGPHQQLYALSPTGNLEWQLKAKADLVSPVVDPAQRRLYVGDQSGTLTAYELRGSQAPTQVWSKRLAASSFGSPALGADGTVYTTAGRSLWAISPQGKIRWSYKSGALVEVSAAVGADGTIVFGSNDTHEYGISPRGKLRWRDSLGGQWTYASVMTPPDGRVLFGDHRGILTVARAHDGKVLHLLHARGQLWTAGASDDNGDVYFASRHGDVYGYGPHGRLLFDRRFHTTFDAYPALAPDGTLLIGGDDGVLRAFAAPSLRSN